MFHAVIVGIDRYADEKVRDLEFARADAEAVARLLNNRIEGNRQVTLLVDERATKARIARVMTDELPRLVEKNDDLLFYFAGHGCPEVDASCGEPSIHAVTHDTEYKNLASTAINLVSELAAWVRRLEARTICVVLDASFNGAAGGRTFEGPGLWSGPRTRRLDRVSLNRLAFGSRAALVTACGDKEGANEEPAYRHGVFTHHFLDVLMRAPAGPVSLGTIHETVSSAVQFATNGAQIPALHAPRSVLPTLHLGGPAMTRVAS
jgi:hypothetical protein